VSELPECAAGADPSARSQFPGAAASAHAPLAITGQSDQLREILLTVSPSQFEAFARDLQVLRDRGAESNTQAIIEAVRDRAAKVRVRPVDESEAA
jgi:hypothetical protein